MNQAINTFFKFNKNTKVGKVAYGGSMLAVDRILFVDVLPWVGNELLNAQRHFSFFAIQGKDNGLYFITYFQEVLSSAQVLRPRHFRNVDKSFYTGCYFNKCTVIGNHNYFTFYFVTNFEIRIQ